MQACRGEVRWRGEVRGCCEADSVAPAERGKRAWLLAAQYHVVLVTHPPSTGVGNRYIGTCPPYPIISFFTDSPTASLRRTLSNGDLSKCLGPGPCQYPPARLVPSVPFVSECPRGASASAGCTVGVITCCGKEQPSMDRHVQQPHTRSFINGAGGVHVKTSPAPREEDLHNTLCRLYTLGCKAGHNARMNSGLASLKKGLAGVVRRGPRWPHARNARGVRGSGT